MGSWASPRPRPTCSSKHFLKLRCGGLPVAGCVKRGRKEKAKRVGDNPEECPVCLTGFDDLIQRPRTLPCGHTVCTLCIDKLKEQGRATCPECRVNHAVPEGGQFPVCYIVEAFIRKMRDGKAAAASPPPSARKGKGSAGAAGKKEATGLSKKMRSFLQEQEATVVAAITACQEAQSQLDQYEATLTGWVERQQQLENSLQGLVDQSRSTRELVQQETFCVAAKKEETKKSEQELQALRKTLRTPATEQEAFKVVSAVFRCTSEAEQVLEECRQCFPDSGILTTAMKVREASSAALKAAQAVQEDPETVSTEETRPQSDPEEPSSQSDPEELSSQSDPDLTIMEKVKFILEPTLKVSQVVPPSLPCTVFLDLSWLGCAPRRVHIHLSPDTPRGQQFILLCTGQRGPSYCGSRLFSVRNKGRPGEGVEGGDYKSNDGKGDCVLLPGLDKSEYRSSGRAGVVWGYRGGLFGITTRDCQDGGVRSHVFGEVVEGLHVVAEAAQHSDIKEVTVMDCGVVL
ncbi:tripartite motif containing 13-like isoform X3 [Eriocheir sinensis]|uniref:tripartite motif containing 13-like isoform X3 n=1 Tax=Eriocheir sinensis TaxID=95602 RepID=UPI0021C8E692|nr:tripartite motif containing 13-like isoform X3 [Eriocheir sinensis]